MRKQIFNVVNINKIGAECIIIEIKISPIQNS